MLGPVDQLIGLDLIRVAESSVVDIRFEEPAVERVGEVTGQITPPGLPLSPRGVDDDVPLSLLDEHVNTRY